MRWGGSNEGVLCGQITGDGGGELGMFYSTHYSSSKCRRDSLAIFDPVQSLGAHSVSKDVLFS